MNTKDITKEIQDFLFSVKDGDYKNFNSKLIPSIDKEKIIGVRIPVLRKLGKQLIKQDKSNSFLLSLPHSYLEENLLHALIVSEIKDFDSCIKEVEIFLPEINNWAVCDIFFPKCFKTSKDKLPSYINKWLQGNNEYSVRFAIGVMMICFLGEDFKEEYLHKVVSIKREAWYIATALAKNYEQTIRVLQQPVLDKWTHNLSIRKALESFRISNERKDYLRGLKINNKN